MATKVTPAANVSIGAIGQPYYDLANHRTKAFLLEVVNTSAQAARLLQGILETAQGNRVTVRLICAKNLTAADLSEVEGMLHGWNVRLEGYVPIQDGLAAAIAYFGANKPQRQPAPANILAEQHLLATIRASHVRHGHFLPSGFTLDVKAPGEIGNFYPHDIGRLVEIYSTSFTGYLAPFTLNSVAAMLDSNYVAVVRDGARQIVAVAMAELAVINGDSYEFSLAEISEVATHPDYHRRGLAHHTFGALVARLRADQIDLIFSECRANHGGILAVALDSGLTPHGHLIAHCVISSRYCEVEQVGRYGNLFIMA